MKKIGKKYKSAKEAIPAEKQSKSEAISLCKNNGPANFDESVDVAFSLGIDPKDAEQNIRTTVSLPNGTGKDVRIAVFAGMPTRRQPRPPHPWPRCGAVASRVRPPRRTWRWRR